MQQLAEADRRKDEFLAILAHELRNPLQPLQTAVEVLEHEPDKPVPARIRKIVQRQVHHITRLVDDLLDVARFTAGKLELRREPTDLGEIVDEAVASCRHGDRRARPPRSRSSPHAAPALVARRPGAPRPVRVQPAQQRREVHRARRRASTSTWGAIAATASSGSPTTAAASRASCCRKIFDMFVQERVTPDGARRPRARPRPGQAPGRAARRHRARGE